ncbi:MAG: chemotaxis-specific protein-glutamate methyltransferase CheB [Pirellulaceae bacterium]|nr:chemotaxis-specific protein-glutamate methyltransferase CheB [Pirellulaceae bacterium]
MRVGLVNDLRLALEALRRVIQSMPDAEEAWCAIDGREAVTRCGEDPPDLILMDLIMPEMNGVEATRQIMRSFPCPILVTTATVTGNRELVYDALGAGAVDAIETPVLGRHGSLQGAEALIRKMRCVLQIANAEINPERRMPKETIVSSPAHTSNPPLVVIGSSTGGPDALREVLGSLRRDCSVVIVQHLGEAYITGLANWLTEETPWKVVLAEAGQSSQVGHAYLANSIQHLVLDDQGHFDYQLEPQDHLHQPSVDVFFSSLCQTAVLPGVGILLTGMGRDGASGLRELRDNGWKTIAQDEKSSIVWGMPGTAAREGAAMQILPLNQIGNAANQYLGSLIHKS